MNKPVHVGTLIERLDFYAEDMDDDDKLPWHFAGDMRQSIDEIRNRDAEINRLRARTAKLVESVGKLVDDLEDLIGESEGVAGLHLNGDLAPWESLLPGGAFEDWLGSITPVKDALTAYERERAKEQGRG